MAAATFVHSTLEQEGPLSVRDLLKFAIAHDAAVTEQQIRDAIHELAVQGVVHPAGARWAAGVEVLEAVA